MRKSPWSIGVRGSFPLRDFPVTCYVLVGVFDVISYLLGEGASKARDFFISGTHVIIAGAIVPVDPVTSLDFTFFARIGCPQAGFL